MRDNFDEALKRILADEGGYSNHPSDPGGPTNFGITIFDYRKYIKSNGTAEDVRNMTVDQAKVIYREHYAKPLCFDDLPGGVDYAVLDYGVNSGVSRAAKVLQRIVGVKDDGEIGDETIHAVRQRDALAVVNSICDERMKFLRGLKTFPVFGGGWTRRVSGVLAASRVMAGRTQQVVPDNIVLPNPYTPPWFQRATALMGLYEFDGSKDNPAILAMAKACGGNIAKTYVHDSTPWCKLFQNYCMKSTGFPSDDSLWALDSAKYGKKLTGPAVGAIACKKRSGGGHVFFVVGRTSKGEIVGRGGNQDDMVCDALFDPDTIVSYNWPSEYPLPDKQSFAQLPVVSPMPRVRKSMNVLPPVPTIPTPGKGEVSKPSTTEIIKTQGAPAAANASWVWACWDWVQAHPITAGGVFILVTLISVIGVHYLLEKAREKKQTAPVLNTVRVVV